MRFSQNPCIRSPMIDYKVTFMAAFIEEWQNSLPNCSNRTDRTSSRNRCCPVT